MQKNVAGQKLVVFAFTAASNTPKTGDAANLTAYVSKDFGAVTVLADVTATEQDATNAAGYYLFDLAQAETNADTLQFTAKSSTGGVVVMAVPAVVFTTPPNFAAEAISAAGGVQLADGVTHGGATAMMRLGASGGTPAFYVTNTGGDAVQFQSTGGGGSGFNCTGTIGFRADGTFFGGYWTSSFGSTSVAFAGATQGAIELVATGAFINGIDINAQDAIGINVRGGTYGLDIFGILGNQIGSNGFGPSATAPGLEILTFGSGPALKLTPGGSSYGLQGTLSDLNEPQAEPGQGAPGSQVSILTKIAHLFKAWRNKKTQTATAFKLFADDGTTVDQKATVSDDGTTATVGEIGSGP